MYLSAILATMIIGSLPFCLLRPWIGILLWSWIGYMSPHRLTWGFAYSMPFAQMVGLAVLVGLPFARERRPLPQTRDVYLFFALWAVFLASTLAALYPEDAWLQLQKVSKIFLMTVVTLLLFQDWARLKTLVWIIVLSIGFFGIKGGIWTILTGAQNQVLGPATTFIEGNTALGVALNMILPLFLFLRRATTRVWLRHALLTAFFLCVVATLGTYSRGALVGLAVVLMGLAIQSRSKLLIASLLIVGLLAVPSFIPDQWFEKMETIRGYEEDESAQARLSAWSVSYQLALERPLLGGGFRTLSREVWARYVPGWESSTDAHSIYFQILAEHGFTGLGIYLALIVSTLLTLRSVRRQTAGRTDQLELHHCASMIQLGIYGYLATGAFLNLCYFDLFYHYVAIAVLLRVIASKLEPAPGAFASLPALPARSDVRVVRFVVRSGR